MSITLPSKEEFLAAHETVEEMKRKLASVNKIVAAVLLQANSVARRIADIRFGFNSRQWTLEECFLTSNPDYQEIAAVFSADDGYEEGQTVFFPLDYLWKPDLIEQERKQKQKADEEKAKAEERVKKAKEMLEERELFQRLKKKYEG